MELKYDFSPTTVSTLDFSDFLFHDRIKMTFINGHKARNFPFNRTKDSKNLYNIFFQNSGYEKSMDRFSTHLFDLRSLRKVSCCYC